MGQIYHSREQPQYFSLVVEHTVCVCWICVYQFVLADLVEIFMFLFLKKSVKMMVPDDGRPPRALTLTKSVEYNRFGGLVDFWNISMFLLQNQIS